MSNTTTQENTTETNEAIEKKPSKFVFVDDMKEALSLGMLAGKNVFLFGPPGHAKSEFTIEMLEEHFASGQIFVQSFGEGMTEDRLWGGVDLHALETEGRIKYNTDNSFLNYEVAVFEEICDAPPNVLVSMKDCLTAREFRNGTQRVPMKTKFIIGLTNKKPNELNNLGDSYKALMERFPIQLEVKWPDYKKDKYVKLIDTYLLNVGHRHRMGDSGIGLLGEFLSRMGEENTPISPRTVVQALDILVATAAQRGATELIAKEDFAHLKFLSGFETFARDIAAEIERAQKIELAKKAIERIAADNVKLIKDAAATKVPLELLKICKSFKTLEAELKAIETPDRLVREVEELTQAINKNYIEANNWALKNTTLEKK